MARESYYIDADGNMVARGTGSHVGSSAPSYEDALAQSGTSHYSATDQSERQNADSGHNNFFYGPGGYSAQTHGNYNDNPYGPPMRGGSVGPYRASPAFAMGITDGTGAIRDVLGSRYATFDPVANQQEQARLEQMRVIQALQAQAAGDPNSQAQQQLAQGYQNAQSQQSSLGSTLRGQSAGAAQRGIQAGQAALGSQMPGQQQMLMLQEQQAAQAMLAQMLAQQRSQDAAWQQGLSGIANDRQGLANANQQFTVGTQYGLDRGMRDANLDLARTRLGLDLEQRNTDRQGLNQWLNAIGSAAGQMYSMGGSNQQATGGSGYRQVDGQNSIVPMNDK